ncbi:MAG: agmatine deiminase family protein, partial [Gammaproteobacteria bacterium]|nr:agmatine deiminase family protein [Gammaproteobacteria bacterium]
MTVRLPAEWEEQSASLLTWPHARSGWGDHLVSVEQVFMDVLRRLTHNQKVIITFHDEQAHKRARAYPEFSDINENNLACYIIPSND